MIALVLFLCHAAFLLSVWEEWKDRGLTDTSFRVLGIMLLASAFGVWGLEPKAWEFEAVEVSTRLVSGLAGAGYVYLLYLKIVDLISHWLRRRDPLRQYAHRYPALRWLFKTR